jgi:MoaA/NifB/PqqE/SkfB family radical SAM enzyme
MQTDPKKIAIYLTNKCNLRCKHCFIEGNPHNDCFLGLPRIKTALKYFYQQGFPRVEFTGGEPYLSPYLIPGLKFAKKIGFNTGISTNGTKNEMFKTISPTFVDKITFSLDGATSKIHDFLRGPNVFNRCIKNIKTAIAKGYRVEVVYTVHHYNLKDIAPTIKLLDKLGVSRLSFNFINNFGSASLNQQFLLDPRRWSKAKKIFSANQNTKTLSLRYPHQFIKPSENPPKCLLLHPVKIEIYPDGNFYSCCLTTHRPELSLGHITDNKVVFDNKRVRQFMKKYHHLPCPAAQTNQLFTISDLKPACLYCKTITSTV